LVVKHFFIQILFWRSINEFFLQVRTTVNQFSQPFQYWVSLHKNSVSCICICKVLVISLNDFKDKFSFEFFLEQRFTVLWKFLLRKGKFQRKVSFKNLFYRKINLSFEVLLDF
jgi:hypothetical protein